jgi:hypothetical protein
VLSRVVLLSTCSIHVGLVDAGTRRDSRPKIRSGLVTRTYSINSTTSHTVHLHRLEYCQGKLLCSEHCNCFRMGSVQSGIESIWMFSIPEFRITMSESNHQHILPSSVDDVRSKHLAVSLFPYSLPISNHIASLVTFPFTACLTRHSHTLQKNFSSFRVTVHISLKVRSTSPTWTPMPLTMRFRISYNRK